MIRPSPMPLLRLFVGAVIFALFASGCASCAEAAERERLRDDRTAAHIYDQPCEMVLAVAREVIFDRGFSVSLADQSALTLETEWRTGGERVEVERSRYLVRGAEPRPDSCAITARIQEQTFDEFREEEILESRRDFDFEWELLELADPAAAASIQDEIDSV